MIEEIFYKVEHEAKRFNPNFAWTDSIDEVAYMINRPHDDYPWRSQKTKELIEQYLEGNLKSEKGMGSLYRITEMDIKSMHSYLFDGLGFNQKHILRGAYRTTHVDIKNTKTDEILFTPPEPLQIPYLMSRVAPIEIGGNERKAFFVMSEEELVWWYRLFETIHPFQDGNGRVGGIVVAIFSYSLYKKYLMPV